MYSAQELNGLRKEVAARLSEKRFAHTIGVEKMAAKLGEYCLPDRISELRAAALLHDIAKEIPQEQQLEFIKKARIRLGKDELLSVPTLHSFASVYLIKCDFPRFSGRDILSACKNHTVGAPRMSIFEEIIFLSDYIEEGRTYADCIIVREKLLSSFCDNRRKNLKALHLATFETLDRTVSHLEETKKRINPKTLLTKCSYSGKI